MAAQGTSPGATSQSSSNHHTSQSLVTSPSPALLSQQSHHQEESAANKGVKEEEADVKTDNGVKLESAVCPKADEVDIMKATEPGSSIHLSTQQVLANSGAESEESIKKYRKYEADYASRLMAKYFSNKDIYGDDIFELKLSIEDSSIRASRRPCMQSFANPLQSYTQPKESTPSPDAEMVGNTSNGSVMEE